ncbi:Ribonuclease H2 subunit A [Podosphaera aphanis]|nr:Ribonuclease H2 subunit A [Podosphaera aphanis]
MTYSQPKEAVAPKAPAPQAFIAPSIKPEPLLRGASYTYFSDVPPALLESQASASPSAAPPGPACVVGVDEAGRGPVLGPMVYGLFYLPQHLSAPLLQATHHFDDSKVLKPSVRVALLRHLCTPGSDLATQCGWATAVLSARDLSANMLKPVATYNLNAQAMDATIALIHGVYQRGINVQEIYIDTIGTPATYQKKLELIFPTARITVAKKADSLFPCVSAASVCAKVTRDAALDLLYHHLTACRGQDPTATAHSAETEATWGSGYPSDVRCTTWLKNNMHPIFGWGHECRFSWGTAKDLLDGPGPAAKVDWPPSREDESESSRLTEYFNAGTTTDGDGLRAWFGGSVGPDVL